MRREGPSSYRRWAGPPLTELPRRNRVGAGSVACVVDLEAAIGFVVAHGDAVDRARLSRLRTGAPTAEHVLITDLVIQ